MVAVALLSAAVGGWLVIAVFDSRAQVVAADLAASVSRRLMPDLNAPSRHPRPNLERQFQV